MKPIAALVAGAAACLLAGCNDKPPTPVATAAPAATPHHDSKAAPALVNDHALGFSIAVPDDMRPRRDFQRSYLANGAWKTFAGPASQGSPALALVLRGSNHITAAELRIGTSTDAHALAHCQDLPSNALPDATGTAVLDGVPFRRFHAGDAAMNHYLDVEGYRAVHDGRCYAIDLLIIGTNPNVYNPPRTPPFARDRAMARLHAALAGLHFDTAR